MKITEIRPQRRNRRRLAVYLDGRYGFGISEKTADKLGLKPGLELTDEDVQKIVKGDELSRAKEYSALLLSYRGRTKKEIRQRLVRKGFEPEVVDKAMNRLAELRLVDDARFAADYTDSSVRHRHKGKRLVRVELKQLGVGSQDIAEALANAPDERAAAEEVARKYNLRNAKLDPRVRRRRLFALLGRRGFALDVIRAVLDITDEEEEEES